MALDLMVDPPTVQKIVDYLTFGEGPLRELRATGVARDLTLADLELNLQRPRILIKVDGTEAAGERGITATTQGAKRIPVKHQAMEAAAGAGVGGSVSGRFAWLYLAPHGRFVFSVLPRAESGFRTAGKIRGKSLSFEWSGSSFDLTCAAPIIPSSGAYNLYVIHDAGYQPRGTDPDSKVQIGAADSFPVGR